MKKQLTAAILAAVMLLAGCGGNGGASQTESSSTPSSSSSASSADSTEGVSTTQTGTILERSKGVTLRNYASATAASWNIQNDTTTDASDMYNYMVDGFYSVKGNESGDGYEFITAMASEFPVDITAQYAGDSTYNVPADATSGYAFSIKLNEDAKWDDGTPITADDYIYSYTELINPLRKNKRANEVYDGQMILANAESYYKQGDAYEDITNDDGSYKDIPDSEMYFSMQQPVFFFGGPASDYYNNPDYAALFTVEGTDLYDKYNDQYYYQLTDEAKADLNALAAAFGDAREEAYKEFCYEKLQNPPVSFDTVGFKKAGDYELHLILDQPISDFYLKYSLSSAYLVKKDVYEACTQEIGGLLQSTYCTSVETSPSFGRYKLAEFIDDKLVRFELNENWYGWHDGEHEWIGNYDAYRIDVIPEYETQFQTFLQGQLDQVQLQPSKSEYQSSDFLVSVPEPTTWNINFYVNYQGLKAQESAGINKTLLSYEDFRKAISIGIDRANIARVLDPLSPATSVMIGGLYIADPDSGAAYRESEYAKEALMDVYGGTEADASYDPAAAKELINKVYEEAVANGDYKDGDVITVLYPRASDTQRGREILGAVENAVLEVLKDTPLEGKFKVDTLLTDEWNEKMVSGEGQVTISGVTGGTMDPYSMVEFMLRPGRTYGFDFSQPMLSIDVNGTPEEHSIYGWVTELTTGAYRDADNDLKMMLLSKVEAAALKTYVQIPVQENATNKIMSMRSSYQYDSYIPMVAFGEVYFSMTDAEWDAYVQSQGGELDYK